MKPNRSGLVKGLALLVTAAALLTGCGSKKEENHQAESHAPSEQGSSKIDWKEMDRMHEEGVKAFPAKTEGKGNQPLQPEMDGNVKVFRLTAQKIQWEVAPGKKMDAYSYNGMVPGPLLRVEEGDRVRVIVKNEMDESTGVHWHGMLIENKADGVPFITQPSIKPGETYTYEFTATNTGTHMYHSHHNAVAQVTGGQLGVLIVDPKDPKRRSYGETQDIPMVLGDGPLGFTINGKGFPATEPIVAKKGEKIRIRFLNMGQLLHPMHLHGLQMKVVERDGVPLKEPYELDTLTIAPGERYDVIVEAKNEGVWAFHCHVLSHAESEHGMHGMVTALIVK
jgi:FtsP/CotA-like multicopper oxidase with cupredoxin domain